MVLTFNYQREFTSSEQLRLSQLFIIKLYISDFQKTFMICRRRAENFAGFIVFFFFFP